MKKKKIAFFIPEIDIGGVEINTLNLSHSIKNQFGRPLLIYLSEKNTELKREFSQTMDLVKIKNRRSIFMFASFKEMLDDHKPDVIVVSSFINLVHLTLLKKFIYFDLKIIFKLETNLKKDLKNQSFLDLLLFLLFKSFSFKLCNLVICSCNALQESFTNSLKIKSPKIITIYNPIVKTEHLILGFTKPDHKFFNNSSDNGKVFISIGRLVKSKGFIELIQTFKKLISFEKMGKSKLLIIGSGYMLKSLNQLINNLGLEESVDIIPFNNSFIDFLASADVFVSNSSYEGLNNNIVHALSQGKQVIATDCEFGPKEVLLNGKIGTLIKPGNNDELLKAMKDIFEHQDFSADLAIERSKDFCIDEISQQFISEIDLM